MPVDIADHENDTATDLNRGLTLSNGKTLSETAHAIDHEEETVDPDLEAIALSSRSNHGPSRDGGDGAQNTTQDQEQQPGSNLIRLRTPSLRRGGRYSGLRKFWRHQIQVNVPHDACRDHLGALS